jgi:hypothetical protein
VEEEEKELASYPETLQNLTTSQMYMTRIGKRAVSQPMDSPHTG